VGSSPGVGRVTARGGLWVTGLFCLALLTIYHETAWSMVVIWSRSETFAHGFLILPISLWLVWSRRDEIASVSPEPTTWWLAFLMLPLGLGWLLAWLGDVAVIQQLALVAMLGVGVWAILGYQLGRMLAFPLFFLFFAVPMGEDLIAPMMEYTATSTVWMIQMSGIPVYREGLNFSLPSGRWSVVEACSGVRYIIASVTVGTLYAYLTYRSWSRRAIFVLVSAIVPVFANSARAYIIVMLGHVSGMKIATGADHLVYGWFFFGLVIFLLFWAGAFFREDQLNLDSGQMDAAASLANKDNASSKTVLLVTACSNLFMASVAPLLSQTLFFTANPEVQKSLVLPAAQGSWRNARAASWWWRPPARWAGQQAAYYESGGEIAGLYVQYADGTFPEAEVIGSSTLFALEETVYRVVRLEKVPVQLPQGEVLVDEAQVRGGGSELLAWSWYFMGEVSTSNKYEAKIQEIKARLGYGAPGAYRIVVTMPVQASLAGTRVQLQNFLSEFTPQLYEELRLAAARGP
jgi:exosortase A